MNHSPEVVPPPTFTPGGRHGHRKPKQFGAGARRALVLAMAVPVASAALVGPSAFAADKNTAATAQDTTPDTTPDANDGLDSADQAIAANLNTRVIDERLGSNVSGVVLDAESDGTVWDHNGATALMPASNTKLATATAALTVLGPDHRFKTKVVYGDGTLTLVGGGDRTLTSADLAAMAKDAVAGLKAAGLTGVKVAVDDSLFPEPTLARGWKADYYPGEIAPVRPLVVDGHAVNDTSIDAGQVFAKQLAADGITVDGEVTRRTADITDVPVTHHRSAKLSDIVHHMMKVSDSNIAETLLRMTALGAGQPATFEGGTAVVRDVLSQRYGVSLENFEMYDGSGLSRDTRIPARTLAEILDLLTEKRYEDRLSSIRDGLPVAGEAGSTLGPEFGRFDDENSKCAVGKVHAKTGTLTGAIALSGLTQGKDGRWKVFSFVENGSTADNSAIRDAIDGLAATVNGCWA
ncbi:D-alanyl-D-alanine carboxypeptidase/D-alanyl-D-alanine endopeptidase [Streptomyces turgidiscabies]|uniref:D-alanyl-D-alanine carboxypeptidase/D-alanyl-D-alanine-endopeptidase (Penicillin-binding protein 4) n=1 Tax=Streptomyces turgidiscabies TaxID=85558 RepID=A0ABU0RS92_9ACTN|nr:D-alanyl-D-alanine carboxypeptidase/D-alanyl-D-alanine-endopeptidase [Streptomyces turgidiscabies]MDQ0934870.1 D-alanyl-D-alanine carboxypeptidase/D-alanyl-D-alanine-endopeptidase (penicillin-binding protein 4) [Streptomyces turgidiscabies]